MATTMFAVAPGTRIQELHRDDAIYCNIFFIAGRRTTESNGATRFVPGSHLGKHDEQPDPRAAVPVELEAGDAFFMLSSCYHGAGENSTEDEERLVYSIFMQPPHVRQRTSTSQSHWSRSRSSRVLFKRRLGYDLAVPNLGWVYHTSPLKSILGYADGDQRVIPGYNPTRSKGVE
ncbi:putative phytanoyl- dioxygenase family protein [Botryosphaeria dothidea]|uniref:Phytanoyl- dioxygenase family protein n=1 Tax=Botryosphaeria dothidea TaxID=55169 RepID=A0A8H4J336_9PEZI|nr:putative phytanoyl- dioxygenase family protein [Botryosphaeria dothidea]